MRKPILSVLVLMMSSPVFADISPDLIPNFHKVSDGIYRGANPIDKAGVAGIKALADLGVRTIIDLQGGDLDGSWFGAVANWAMPEPGEQPDMIATEQKAAEAQGIKFVNLPLDSHAVIDQKEAGYIQQALAILSDSTQQPIFIHCEHGADRTGLVIALYRVLHQGWLVKDAVTEWQNDGHTAVSALVTGDLDKYFYQSVESQP